MANVLASLPGVKRLFLESPAIYFSSLPSLCNARRGRAVQAKKAEAPLQPPLAELPGWPGQQALPSAQRPGSANLLESLSRWRPSRWASCAASVYQWRRESCSRAAAGMVAPDLKTPTSNTG
ncbi:complexin-2 isoform X2 [Sphaerodactylus townsendi]|uniref:complexin-2 isoform X2 n=1 Tax=Sphaerodactylus townsendi TaxID=933632 RepID=UPI002025F3E7|nr:complexin-2 isoform X2 [Sphaerodactylus townsendi]